MRPQQSPSSLAQRLIDTFKPLIDPARPVALIDYPDYQNAGDHAIWLGTKALLKQLGVELSYQCSMQSYNRAAMTEALGDGTILMQGGGNFGDLYAHHEFRHRVLQDFPGNRVVVMPQTVMFFSDEAMRRSAKIFATHGKVTIAARNALSFHILQKHFAPGADIVLTPDCANMLEDLRRFEYPVFDVVWLSRTDIETGYSIPIAEITRLPGLKTLNANLGTFPDGITMTLAAEVSGQKLLVSDWLRCQFQSKEDAAAYYALDFDTKSKFWVERAIRLLSGGRIVITDRLHGHILCTLAGIPHILLNNNYGKNIAYYETWSRPSPLCQLAPTPRHAWDMAQFHLKKEAELVLAGAQSRAQSASG